MDDPNMTMEEYIMFEEEKARRRGRVFNWQTATYGKVGVDDDLYNLRSVETKFPAIVIDDTITPQDALPNLKSNEDNDDNEIDIIQSSEGNEIVHGSCVLSEMIHDKGTKTFWTGNMAPLPLPEQRHLFLRYQGLDYTDEDIADFEERLERIYGHEMDRAWGRLFDTRGPLVRELILEFFSTLRFGESESERMIPGKGDLHDYWRDISTHGDFLGPPPSYFDQRSGLDVRSVNIPYLLARYLRRFATRRKSGAHISGGQFVARLAEHFGLLTAEILGGLTFDDTWARVAMGLERQPNVAASALVVAEDASVVDEGDQAIPAPMQAPQQPPPPLLMEASRQTYQAFDGTFQGSSPRTFQRRTRQRTGEASTSIA
ncbi:hypothetical protein Tco_0988737 [Tanacetum coccineum]|uniref:Uncharacterized protein n=1 Tax=Tanacetum coccineum TaxID=301880 RepID=A0ABQ5ERT4_9ASTR